MIGRGAVANPFLPAVIKSGQDDVGDKVEKFRKFYEDLFEDTGRCFPVPGICWPV